MDKYGKSMGDLLKIKQTFFNMDTALYKENLFLSEIAQKQIHRVSCKNCDVTLDRDPDFVKQNIPYVLCNSCNHLNSLYEDTESFAKAIYVEEVTDYSKVYSAETQKIWLERMKSIYLPKAQFLKEVLIKEGVANVKEIADFGAGSGYFVKALQEVGFIESVGYEVSENQVNLSQKMLENNSIKKIELNDLKKYIAETKYEVISLIGVLEHLTNPREILREISKNNDIKYIYLSLPLFSYTVFFEILNEDHFNRHLSGGHTHLYTIESINNFCEEFGLEISGKWQFGVDAMDLYRFQHLELENKLSDKMRSIFTNKFTNILDELQLVFDKEDFSSEIHLVLKNSNN